MANTNIEFLGKTLKSPIFAAVGPHTQSVEDCLAALHNGAGAIEVQFHRGDNNLWDDYRRVDLYAVVPHKSDADHERYYGLISTGMNIRKEQPHASYIEFTTERLRKIRAGADANTLVVANIGRVGYRGDGLYTWGELARRVTDAGAEAVSLHMQTGNIMAGGILTRDPDFLKRIVDEVRSCTALPIIAKLPVEGCDPALVADLAYQCGCDAVASTGRFIGLLPDIHTGKCELGGHIGYGGSWVLPNTCAWTARMYRSIPDRKLIPGGGVNSWEDILRVIMCGGAMVQTCTWTMVKGYAVLQDALRRIVRYLDENHLENLEALRGSVAKTAVASADLWARKLTRSEAPMYGIDIHDEQCTRCMRCLENCHFDAITQTDGKLHIDPSRCVGCGCCRGTCRFDAIY